MHAGRLQTKYFPSAGRKAFLKLAKAILVSVYCSSKDGDLAAPAVPNVPLGEKRREGQATENKKKLYFFHYLSQHPWILLTKFGSLTAGRNTGYFLHSQNYLQSSDMILGESPLCLRASMSMKEIHPIDYFPQPAYISLAIPKSKCRAQALPQQYQQSEASPVL